MKKFIIFLLLALSVCIFAQDKKPNKTYLMKNGKTVDNSSEMEDDEENIEYWETYVEDDTVENDIDLYEDPIEDDTEKNIADFRKK
ncbi:hypothetical protein EII28_03805 [Fusobacterium nucleatum]|uniref:Secreted protein n=1 Tax=Fusobacterium nucleatum TaxID=851 RepID=A0A3P1VX76_FUSNU|nr:hypothetical protein [Fusobacterium nucleatum]RRD37740.1 hypothetical protein EII28_03805 [Fusobacterium nucleatum]